eukprot:6023158-Amphidinium_carterae.2
MKVHFTQAAVKQGLVTAEDLFGNRQADHLANLGTAEPATSWIYCAETRVSLLAAGGTAPSSTP